MPSDADIELLQAYDWPGNIRELGAVIDRAAILGDGDSLELAAALGVGAPIGLRPLRNQATRPRASSRSRAAQRLATLNDAMRAHIEAALRVDARPRRRPARCGAAAGDQSAHAAGPDAEAENRLDGVSRARIR